MNDLRCGMLSTGYFEVGPGLLFRNVKDKIPEDDVFRTKRSTTVDADTTLCGIPCRMQIHFYAGILGKLEVFPLNVKYKSYPDKDVQDEEYASSKRILSKLLPDTDKEETDLHVVYRYDWGDISCFKVMDGKGAYTGGYINVWYKRGQATR